MWLTRTRMATPNKQPKAMSSRLLTMKFMQRASASPASTPSTPSEPPSKKQRLSNGSSTSTPSSMPRLEAQTVEQALAAEEQKRAEALEREAADRGETKWVLTLKQPPVTMQEPPMRIVSAGFATLDVTNQRSPEDGEEAKDLVSYRTGRRSFGRFNRASEREEKSDELSFASNSSRNGESEEADDNGDPIGARAMIAQSRTEAGEKARQERKVKRKAEAAEFRRLAEERRTKQVKLNQLTSISGGGFGGDMVCHRCSQKGHIKRDCPQDSQQRHSRLKAQ